MSIFDHFSHLHGDTWKKMFQHHDVYQAGLGTGASGLGAAAAFSGLAGADPEVMGTLGMGAGLAGGTAGLIGLGNSTKNLVQGIRGKSEESKLNSGWSMVNSLLGVGGAGLGVANAGYGLGLWGDANEDQEKADNRRGWLTLGAAALGGIGNISDIVRSFVHHHREKKKILNNNNLSKAEQTKKVKELDGKRSGALLNNVIGLVGNAGRGLGAWADPNSDRGKWSSIISGGAGALGVLAGGYGLHGMYNGANREQHPDDYTAPQPPPAEGNKLVNVEE